MANQPLRNSEKRHTPYNYYYLSKNDAKFSMGGVKRTGMIEYKLDEKGDPIKTGKNRPRYKFTPENFV